MLAPGFNRLATEFHIDFVKHYETDHYFPIQLTRMKGETFLMQGQLQFPLFVDHIMAVGFHYVYVCTLKIIPCWLNSILSLGRLVDNAATVGFHHHTKAVGFHTL